jgi:hypothetical protein
VEALTMNLFSFIKKSNKPNPTHFFRVDSQEGMLITREEQLGATALGDTELVGLMTQLVDDGHATIDSAGSHLLTWEQYFCAESHPAYPGLTEALKLPAQTTLRPTLASKGALSDTEFGISVGPWIDSSGKRVAPGVKGAILETSQGFALMSGAQWQLLNSVSAFSSRPADERSEQSNRLAWGRIRQLANSASASTSDFLTKTVILTPDRLDIKFRRSDAVSDDTVIEVIPGFDEAPSAWLEQFDRFSSVHDRYDLPQADGGLVQVILSPEVRTVLEEIKRYPSRRLAGARAQSFLLNPYSTIGEAASSVIDEEQFASAREDAGLTFERFTPIIRPPVGYPEIIGILVESANEQGPMTARELLLSDDEARKFLDSSQQALIRQHQLIFWDGYELEVLGETPQHLEQIEQALERREQGPLLVTHAAIHDLEHYSSRIEGLGVEKPYYSAYIAKKQEDGGWFAENVFPVIAYTPEGASDPQVIALSDERLAELTEATRTAESQGKSEVDVPWLPTPIKLDEARALTSTFDEVIKDVRERKFAPEQSKQDKPGAKKTLVLRPNIDYVDYDERRSAALRLQGNAPQIASTFSDEFKLLKHQFEGVARIQQLHRLREEFQVRGMVLADDMGLGKTVQLLSVMAHAIEASPHGLKPMLVVAPVSLLENWKEEADRFYPGAFHILTAYGDTLKRLRVPREAIEERLRTEDGLVKFLMPNWVGAANLVLTTYETLRDLELSFALQPWSIMVCDEAQRIKNPAAMVTRSAKKQNAAFKIACTGTPVENTLADLWCLFDFVQPGLLGALNEFGRRYRRPIEIDERDKEALARIDELRALIEPQILRRTKINVIKDLPAKVIVESCRKLPISVTQRNLYSKAIESFKKRNDPAQPSPFKNHLGLLQYLRLVCTDPRRHGLTASKPDALEAYRLSAPKMNWLLSQLQTIKRADEKVIIFCEFRNIQRLLQHYIAQVFGFEADIINGDTSASASHSASRQKRIKAFQAKPGFGVIILSPVAVGFGVNIQAANHVIHYTRTWNPAKEDQATDRAWRIGQKKDVYVYFPVVTAEDFKTFDEKLDQLLERKRALAGDMLNGSPDISLSDFQLEDVVPAADAEGLDERVTFDLAMQLDWRHFEGLAAALWTKLGYETVYCTPPSGDHGVDVVAIKGNQGALIQTKTYADDRPLNWEAVKDVVTGEAFYRRRHPSVTFKRVGFTNQRFNELAHQSAELNGVQLIEQPKLQELLSTHAVSMLQIERFIFTTAE